MWYIYTMEYYSAVKENTFESVLMRWMKLEPIIQNEVSQKEKNTNSILTHLSADGHLNGSADKWIRKLWYIYKMEYYSIIN